MLKFTLMFTLTPPSWSFGWSLVCILSPDNSRRAGSTLGKGGTVAVVACKSCKSWVHGRSWYDACGSGSHCVWIRDGHTPHFADAHRCESSAFAASLVWIAFSFSIDNIIAIQSDGCGTVVLGWVKKAQSRFADGIKWKELMPGLMMKLPGIESIWLTWVDFSHPSKIDN